MSSSGSSQGPWTLYITLKHLISGSPSEVSESWLTFARKQAVNCKFRIGLSSYQAHNEKLLKPQGLYSVPSPDLDHTVHYLIVFETNLQVTLLQSNPMMCQQKGWSF